MFLFSLLAASIISHLSDLCRRYLAVQAECFYFLGELEKSKELYLQAYSLYEAFEDESNMKNMRREMSEYLGIEGFHLEVESHT